MSSLNNFSSGTQDPSVVATYGAQGSFFVRLGQAGINLYQKQDAGSSTNWSLVAGGSGGLNFATTVFADSNNPAVGTGSSSDPFQSLDDALTYVGANATDSLEPWTILVAADSEFTGNITVPAGIDVSILGLGPFAIGTRDLTTPGTLTVTCGAGGGGGDIRIASAAPNLNAIASDKNISFYGFIAYSGNAGAPLRNLTLRNIAMYCDTQATIDLSARTAHDVISIEKCAIDNSGAGQAILASNATLLAENSYFNLDVTLRSISTIHNCTIDSGAWTVTTGNAKITNSSFDSGASFSPGSRMSVDRLTKRASQILGFTMPAGHLCYDEVNKVPVREDSGAVVTVLSTDYVIVASNAGGPTVNLPPGEEGMIYIIKGGSAGATVVPDGAETIDGNPSAGVPIMIAYSFTFVNGQWYITY